MPSNRFFIKAKNSEFREAWDEFTKQQGHSLPACTGPHPPRLVHDQPTAGNLAGGMSNRKFPRPFRPNFTLIKGGKS